MTNGDDYSTSLLQAPSSRAELEFRRFARDRIAKGINENEPRLLALFLRRFSEVAPLGTGHGRRAGWIVEHWRSAEIEDLSALLGDSATSATESFPIRSMRLLQVGPFRGFAQTETVELDRPVSFVYGPNGTGKSSLCEALEYVMLGFIEDAKAKRIELPDYVAHLPTGEFQAPVLTAILNDGSAGTVKADANAYRFCFIEKNRIDAFARLTATTPAAQAHRISSLFGLEDFGQYVDGFTENFERYLTLQKVKPAELEQREREIAIHRQTVQANPERRAELGRRQEELAARSGLGVPFCGLTSALFGDVQEGRTGRLDGLDSLIETPAAYRRDELGIFDLAVLQEVVAGLVSALDTFTDLQSQLASRATEVDFSKLFEAVQGVRDNWAEDSCPACLTPLDMVT